MVLHKPCGCLGTSIFTRQLMYSSKKGVNRNTIAFLQQPIDLSMASIKRWWKKKKWQAHKANHQFITRRHETLGPDLATSHFVLARGGAVKFEGIERWFEADKDGNIRLPGQYVQNMNLEAIDCTNTPMIYDSFDNFVNLQHLRYLNLSHCAHIDDWCLDKMAWLFRDTVEWLDLSECPKVTERGLASLHRFRNLKKLILYRMPAVQHSALLGLMLEEALPGCIVEGIDFDSMEAPAEKENHTMPGFLSPLHKEMTQFSTSSHSNTNEEKLN